MGFVLPDYAGLHPGYKSLEPFYENIRFFP